MINKLAAQAYENMMLSTEMTKLALSDTDTLFAASGIGAVGGGLGGAVLGALGPAPSDKADILHAVDKVFRKPSVLGGVSGFDEFLEGSARLENELRKDARRSKILKRGLIGLGAGAALGLGTGHLINVLNPRDEEETRRLESLEKLRSHRRLR